ncbi:hypothetical protein K458DRAFT_384870 [Lentithecium fluviatile CBS 122367]|uniref:Uncharacterized protein n=1 Tax=Lentithecium fluviatile CBS 122367 TaxID=1168545 RepID=A0A6G1JEX4_9PLEO|nr:hypothetical protein K458DRAFT_384870 [Lentithecium fluviatile CBS 122367]
MSTVRITISRKFPTLFAVNQVARYESAKLDGGEWSAPIVRYEGSDDGKAFAVYFNFNIDNLFITERFMNTAKVSKYSWTGTSTRSPLWRTPVWTLHTVVPAIMWLIMVYTNFGHNVAITTAVRV